MEFLIALVALAAMEIVLGIDNIVFIAIVTSRLPADQQPRARRLGLLLAMGMRIVLLLTLSVILQLDDPLIDLSSFGFPTESWTAAAEREIAELETHIPLTHQAEEQIFELKSRIHTIKEMAGVSGKDLILLFGGLFLIWKSVHEIHNKIEGDEDEAASNNPEKTSFRSVLVTIALMDIVFSIDSVITAVGMVRADGAHFWSGISVMVTAVVLAVGVMVIFAERVSRFVDENPTLKMLALSFLILIGAMLVAEGIGTHFDKGYIYFAMAFAIAVEILNLRLRRGAEQENAA
ncbi:MAG: TerC family protein [Planctomycetota bacterium]|nr:TerC family protein [Planctomycetota bacterium]